MSSSPANPPQIPGVVDEAWFERMRADQEAVAAQQTQTEAAMREAEQYKVKLEALAQQAIAKYTFGTSYVSAAQSARLKCLAIEKLRRKMDALALFEPLEAQRKFLESKARVRLLRGSNRGGKTLPAAVEVARTVRGMNPRYPTPGRVFCAGKDQKHIAQTMWHKLSRPGAFKIIRDLETDQWRAYRPWAEFERVADTMPCSPLIPERMIAKIGWENLAEGVPNIIKMHNGWEIMFFSGKGTPPKGADIEMAWIDEELPHPDWFPELSARLLDRNGQLIWSATPQAGTLQLYELHEKAEQQYGQPNPDVEEFIVLLDENPHISAEAKRAFSDTLTEDERLVRISGQFAMLTYRVFTEFQKATHLIPYEPVPQDWTRYVGVDPGRHVTACIFLAVSPKQDGYSRMVIYDELYLQDCTADDFGKAMREKVGEDIYEAFVIDFHGSIKHEMATGMTIVQQFTEALRRYGVKSAATGHSFVYGSDDRKAGIMAMRDMLRIRDTGKPQLQVMIDKCPWFIREIQRYHNQKINGIVTDEPDKKQEAHTMDAWRYLAMLGPKWKPAPKKRKTDKGVFKILKEMKEGQSGPFVRLGPGGNR